MAGYAARRLLAAIPVLFFVSFVTFGLIRLAPGDPVLIVLGGRRVSPELIDPAAGAVRPGRRPDHPVRRVAGPGAPARLRAELQAPPGGRRPHPGAACRSRSSSSRCRCSSPIVGRHPAGRAPGAPARERGRLRGLVLRVRRRQLPGLLHGHPRGARVRGLAGLAARVRQRRATRSTSYGTCSCRPWRWRWA